MAGGGSRPAHAGANPRPAPTEPARRRRRHWRSAPRSRPRWRRLLRRGSGRCPEASSGTARSGPVCAIRPPRPWCGKARRRTSNAGGTGRCGIPENAGRGWRASTAPHAAPRPRLRPHPCRRPPRPPCHSWRHGRRCRWPTAPGSGPNPWRKGCSRRRTAPAATKVLPGSSPRETRPRLPHLRQRNRW